MNDLVAVTVNLPVTMEDLSKFVLIGREKLSSVKAEIRAIDKIQLAENVRNQKKEEAQMLSEALLDAEVRLGDLLKRIPKATNNNKQGHNQYTGGQGCTAANLTYSEKQTEQTKSDVIKGLGFSKDQAHRFETLAENKDIVEQVKKEARQNDDIPTRSRVLDLAKERRRIKENKQKNNDEYNDYIDRCTITARKYTSILYDIDSLDVNGNTLSEWKEMLNDNNAMISDFSEMSLRALPKLQTIQQFLRRCKSEPK